MPAEVEGEVLTREQTEIFSNNNAGDSVSVTNGVEAEVLLPKEEGRIPAVTFADLSFPKSSASTNTLTPKEDGLEQATLEELGEIRQPENNSPQLSSFQSQLNINRVQCDRPHFQDALTFKSMMAIVRGFFAQYKTAPFFHIRLVALGVLLIVPLILPTFLSGILWGLYIAMMIFFYVCVTEIDHSQETAQQKLNKDLLKGMAINDPSQTPIYQGWMNILHEQYNPRTFHINMAETVMATLEGHILKISHPEVNVMRNTFHIDPTLSEKMPKVTETEVFDLTKAKIKLRPARLSSRRWFSRKYPILIKLAELERSQLSGAGEWSLPALDKVGEEESCHDCDEEDEGGIGETESIASEMVTSTRPKCTRRHRTICLFPRNSREKEQWFHKLRMASQEYAYPFDKQLPIMLPVASGKMPKEYYLYLLQGMEFNTQLTIIRNEAITFNQQTGGVINMDLGLYKDWDKLMTDEASPIFMAVANLLTTRIFYDVCRDEKWLGMIRNKVKSKIGAVHMPNFIEDLKLTNFDLGTTAPVVTKFYPPVIDQWGTWIDYEIDYHGKLCLTIETQVNLQQMNDEAMEDNQTGDTSYFHQGVKNHALTVPDTHYSDEELPLSPEDDPEEDYGSKNERKKLEEAAKKKPGRKILNLVDKITHSSIFKGASDFKLVRMAMEKISETRLILNVEITEMTGRMTINIAHPPSDRLWYGFRETPNVTIKSTPQVGEQTVAFPAISHWIEGNVVNLMEKFLVFPNLDDIVVPLLTGNELLRPTFTQ